MRRILIGCWWPPWRRLTRTERPPRRTRRTYPNWTAPPFWAGREAPASEEQADRTSGRSAEGRSALAAGRWRFRSSRCPRAASSTRGRRSSPRRSAGGFLPPATVRSYTLTGVCGLPANAQAVSLNVTVVHPTGPGFITLYPQGGAFPPVSTLNYLGNDVIVNAAVVPLSVAGGISMALGVSGGDVILDTNGYYAVSDVASLERPRRRRHARGGLERHDHARRVTRSRSRRRAAPVASRPWPARTASRRRPPRAP